MLNQCLWRNHCGFEFYYKITSFRVGNVQRILQYPFSMTLNDPLAMFQGHTTILSWISKKWYKNRDLHMHYSRRSFLVLFSHLGWQRNIQLHESSRSLSAIAELLGVYKRQNNTNTVWEQPNFFFKPHCKSRVSVNAWSFSKRRCSKSYDITGQGDTQFLTLVMSPNLSLSSGMVMPTPKSPRTMCWHDN